MQFTGSIPASYEAIPSLQIIDLSNNALSGALPANFTFNSSLQYNGLWVYGNAFSGAWARLLFCCMNPFHCLHWGLRVGDEAATPLLVHPASPGKQRGLNVGLMLPHRGNGAHVWVCGCGCGGWGMGEPCAAAALIGDVPTLQGRFPPGLAPRHLWLSCLAMRGSAAT